MSFPAIAVAYGDGIGPEIMSSVLHILKESGAKIKIESVEIGEKIYSQGYSSGISKNAWEVIKKNKILLKAPITTPQGKGYKSLNVTFRKTLGLFANIRPVMSLDPFVPCVANNMDLVIVRENEEDLYAGVEYRTTESSYLSLKLISEQGCEKIIRYAFEYAKSNQRKRVSCFIKDDIMKMTDGIFHNTFKKIAAEYPKIGSNSYLVDIGSARIASKPQDFDVIVTLNLYGDIISDIAAEVSGSVGVAGSANIGTEYAMFEAVHGSAPDIAGKNIANPSGLLNAAIFMLEHIAQQNTANVIKNAWLKTIEDGMHTADIYKEGLSTQRLSTTEFTSAIIKNLGKKPKQLAAVSKKSSEQITIDLQKASPVSIKLKGVDIYLEDSHIPVNEVIKKVKMIDYKNLELKSVAQRGLLVWPVAEVENPPSNMLRLRFLSHDNSPVDQKDILDVQKQLIENGFGIALTHSLNNYDGSDGFSKAQGE